MKLSGRSFCLVAVVIMMATVAGSEEIQKDEWCPSQSPELVKKFNELNKEYFENQLSAENACINWADGTGTYFRHFEDEPLIARINIGSYLKDHDKNITMDMLHEMSHYLVMTQHPELVGSDFPNTEDKDDELFQSEMHRLADIGAFNDYW